MGTPIFREPLLVGARSIIILVASLFAAYCWYRAGIETFSWNTIVALVFCALGFAVFGFVQGMASILNAIVYPVLGYFNIGVPTLNYILGVVFLVVFLLVQFRPVVGFVD